jgi:ferredoxin
MKNRLTLAAMTLAALCALIVQCGIGPTQGAFLRVNEAQCMGCGDCMGVCNSDAIRLFSSKAVIDPTKCVQCGKCTDICPVQAIW